MATFIGWADLRFDGYNPRLPEGVQGGDRETLLRYYLQSESADELVGSMLESGFFEHEPLLVLPKDENGHHVVLEGNRRLAAVTLIHGGDVARAVGWEMQATDGQRARLDVIPCVVVAGRDEVRTLIGYRHIGGLKKWKPEAKARFIVDMVDAAAAAGSENPFLEVAREVGSNSQGIRNSYLAMKILLWAREEHGQDVAFVQYDRFGVWHRALNSADVRRFIGLQDSRDFPSVSAAIQELDIDNLREVLSDLTPREGGRSVLGDSRQVTQYGRVIASPRARSALRTYGSLAVANQIVRTESLPDRIVDLAQLAEVLLREINDSEYSEGLEQAATQLYGVARTLQAAVRGLKGDLDA